jgi:hypothetical protein
MATDKFAVVSTEHESQVRVCHWIRHTDSVSTTPLLGQSANLLQTGQARAIDACSQVRPSPQPYLQKEANMAVKPIPEGYHSVTPYLIIKGAAKAIDF